MWAYRPVGFLIAIGLRVLGGVRSVGLENLPRTGPVILVANHYTLADPLVAVFGSCWRIGRVVHMVSKVEVRRWPLIGWLGTQGGVIYVNRRVGDLGAQRKVLAALAAGRALLIFPEGTRSPGGALIPARNGAALLAMRSGAPVVPLGITGTEGMFSWRAVFGPRPRATVRIGQPFTLTHRPDGPIDRVDLVEGTTRLMREVAALLPPAQRGVYG
ncbi:MAG: lysophospholipid acyltransferase family protein [Candidatus Limnocylindria bacterium]